jgi:hypothetical protein
MSTAIRLVGFEEGLCARIAQDFNFASLPDLDLKVGRHLFAGWMPEAADIQRDIESPETFDPKIEPVMAVYGDPRSGPVQSLSYGGKHILQGDLVMRLPKDNNAVSAMLGELLEWISENLPNSSIGAFRVISVRAPRFPGNYQRLSDASVFASGRLDFLAVPTLT